MLLPAAYLAYRVSQDLGASFDVATSARAMTSLRQTVYLAAATSAGAILISLPIAWLTTRTDLPFARAWFVLLTLPLAVPSYVSALVVVLFLGPKGMLQGWLEPLGVDRLPEIYGFPGAWLALTLFTYPYVLLPIRAAFRTLDPALEEAARSLGKPAWIVALRVTLPHLRPALAAGAILVALYTLSDFGAVSLMNYRSLSNLIYIQYRGTFDRDAAAALAMLLVLVALAVVTLDVFTRGRARYHAQAAPRAAAPIPLGRWRWPAIGALSLLALVAVGMPVFVLVWQVAEGVSNGESLHSLATPVRNSMTVSLLGAGLTVIAALPIAWMAVRRPGTPSRLFERASYSGYALPGIVVALALVFFGARYVPALYQTLPWLLFAYMVRFLPEALGASRASLLQINPATEEAGRSLGRGPLTVFFRVTLPQMAPGLWAAGALVFLTVMKELPATLLLSPIGFDTLAVDVWSLSREAYFARAAYSAITLVALAAIPVALLAIREKPIS